MTASLGAGALLGWCSSDLGLSQQQCPPSVLRYKELGQTEREKGDLLLCPLKAVWELGTDLRSLNYKMVVLLSRTPCLVSDMRGLSPFSCSPWLGFKFPSSPWEISLTAEVKCPGANSPSLHRVVKE